RSPRVTPPCWHTHCGKAGRTAGKRLFYAENRPAGLASRNDSRACDAMASELTLIHGVPPGCDEREYLSELQNALLWINYRYYRSRTATGGAASG
ncbi:regulatory signaling modulator protein AmpE, partial [Klebsiella pneumoniae]|uniref:regulatory signaling modulator protein AmpE n=1 Tax=Klebsiella pneumoniae TaxID=573 RepID=UPI003D80A4B7